MKHTSHSSTATLTRPAAMIAVFGAAIAVLHIHAASDPSEAQRLGASEQSLAVQPSPAAGIFASRGKAQRSDQPPSESAIATAPTFDPCPGEWTAPFNDVGLAGETMYALAAFEEELYAGGTFTTAGGEAVNHIARWDGESWSALDGGTNGLVRTMLVHDGSLYVGGHFTSAGGSPANRIARWDGESWHTVGDGFNNAVMTLAVHEDQVIAGGFFTHAGATEVNRIARWDANADDWQPLGGGMNRSVLALASTDIGLVAGGHFTTADGVTVGRVALWSSGQWTRLGGGSIGPVLTLINHNGLPILGGAIQAKLEFHGDPQFDEDPENPNHGAPADRALEWSSFFPFWLELTESKMFPTPNHSVIDMLEHNGSIFAVGKFTDVTPANGMPPVPANLVARWDGETWHPLGDGLAGTFNGSAEAMTVHGGKLIVGGYFATAGGQPATSIAAWDAPPSAGPADLNCDGDVNVEDLFMLLANWGECDDPEACLGDLDGNGVVDVDDLFILLAQWR